MKSFVLALAAVLILGTRTLLATEIVAGPMIGHVTDTSARLWLQLDTSERVTVTCIEVDSNQRVSEVTIDVEGPSPFVLDTPLSNLQPNKNYRVEVRFDGKPVKLPDPPLVVRSAPPAGDAATFTVAFGSCMNPKDPAAKDAMPVFKAVREVAPRAFLFLGDNGYFPNTEREFGETRRAAYRFMNEQHSRIRQHVDLQNLFRSTAVYAIWDDHDFGPNDANRTWTYGKEALTAFKNFWPNPEYGTADAPGVYHTFSIGDVDFFMLDVRMYRDPDKDPERKTMVGEVQFNWLKDKLKKSNATFKVIGAGSQVLADYSKFDSWAHYRAERDALLDFIFKEKISGVVFISGDRHMGELTLLKPDEKDVSRYPLFDLTSSPLSAKLASPATIAEKNPNRVGEVLAEHNFGTLDFGGARTKRFVTLRLRDAKGVARLEQTVFASQLQAP